MNTAEDVCVNEDAVSFLGQNFSIPRLRALEVSLRRTLRPLAFALYDMLGYQTLIFRREHPQSRGDRASTGMKLSAIMQKWLHGVIRTPLKLYAFSQYHMPNERVATECKNSSESPTIDTLDYMLQTVVLFARSFLDGCPSEFVPFYERLFRSQLYLDWLSQQTDV